MLSEAATKEFGKHVQPVVRSLIKAFIQKIMVPGFKSLCIDINSPGEMKFLTATIKFADDKEIATVYEVPIINGSISIYDSKKSTSTIFNNIKNQLVQYLYGLLTAIDDYCPEEIDRAILTITPTKESLNSTIAFYHDGKTVAICHLLSVDKLVDELNSKMGSPKLLTIVNKIFDIQDTYNNVKLNYDEQRKFLAEHYPPKTKLSAELGSISIIASHRSDIDFKKVFAENPKLKSDAKKFMSESKSDSCKVTVAAQPDPPKAFVGHYEIDDVIELGIDLKNLDSDLEKQEEKLRALNVGLTSIVTPRGKITLYQSSSNHFQEVAFRDAHPEIDWGKYTKESDTVYARVNMNKKAKSRLK